MKVNVTIDIENKEIVIHSSVTLDEVMKLLEEFGLKEKGYGVRFEFQGVSGNSLPLWRAFSVPCAGENRFKVVGAEYNANVVVKGLEEGDEK